MARGLRLGHSTCSVDSPQTLPFYVPRGTDPALTRDRDGTPFNSHKKWHCSRKEQCQRHVVLLCNQAFVAVLVTLFDQHDRDTILNGVFAPTGTTDEKVALQLYLLLVRGAGQDF